VRGVDEDGRESPAVGGGAEPATYKPRSMTGGIGIISVPSSCSIVYKLNL
jgi:hypothetical protein